MSLLGFLWPQLPEIKEEKWDVPVQQEYGHETNRSQSTIEIGSAGTRYRREIPGGEEYNTVVAGIRGLEVFDRMRRSDATVRRALRIAKTPVLSGRWYISSADPGNTRHDNVRDFVKWCLFSNMRSSWTQFLTEALTMLEFGYSFFEKVYMNESTPFGMRTVLKEMAPRSPFDVEYWRYDNKGRPTSVEMRGFDTEQVVIPYEKLITFSMDKENNNIEGVSLLRSAYKHWYFKDNLYKIDAIQKERHGIGIPIIKLPHNFNKKDLEEASDVGKNLRTNEQAHVVLPPGWELNFAEIKGQPVNPMESIMHHDACIERNVLADFLSTSGSEAAEVQSTLFLKATRYLADILRDEINHRVIPELVRYNYGTRVREFPKLEVRRVAEESALRVLTFAMRNLVGADILRPDDELERWVREEMFLTAKDDDTERTPAVKTTTGGSRQGAPSSSQGAGTGDDKSGTSDRE